MNRLIASKSLLISLGFTAQPVVKPSITDKLEDAHYQTFTYENGDNYINVTNSLLPSGEIAHQYMDYHIDVQNDTTSIFNLHLAVSLIAVAVNNEIITDKEGNVQAISKDLEETLQDIPTDYELIKGH